MKVGDVVKVKFDQDCTAEEAYGQLCIIESIYRSDIMIRIQGHTGAHYIQTVREEHLEEI